MKQCTFSSAITCDFGKMQDEKEKHYKHQITISGWLAGRNAFKLKMITCVINQWPHQSNSRPSVDFGWGVRMTRADGDEGVSMHQG